MRGDCARLPWRRYAKATSLDRRHRFALAVETPSTIKSSSLPLLSLYSTRPIWVAKTLCDLLLFFLHKHNLGFFYLCAFLRGSGAGRLGTTGRTDRIGLHFSSCLAFFFFLMTTWPLPYSPAIIAVLPSCSSYLATLVVIGLAESAACTSDILGIFASFSPYTHVIV